MLLVVTAVEAEAQALRDGLGDEAGIMVRAVGAGPAAAAAGTAYLLATEAAGCDTVVSAGIAGGFDLPAGAVVLADSSVAADLGADSPDGFLSLDTLGFGVCELPVDAQVLGRLRGGLPAAVTGPILTVSTVTGTASRAAQLLARHPGARAEAMEGFGVASGAAVSGRRFAELRTISNAVGPRDRAAWRIPDALAALRATAPALAALV